jgi:hypothetical protein
MTWTFYNAQGQEKRSISWPAATPIDPWHLVGAAGEPAFQNSWVNYGGAYAPAAFRKMPDGTVRLRGTVKSGTNASAIFTLPVGYRPAAVLTPASESFSTSYVDMGLAIFPTGNVNHQGTINTQVWLDVSFIAEDLPITELPAGPKGERGDPGAVLANATYSNGFPSSGAVDGEQWDVADTAMAAMGVRWRMVYREDNDNWEFVGGNPYYLENDTVFSTVASHTTYQDVGMGFTLPFPGTYLVDISGLITTAAVAGNAGLISVRYGTVGSGGLAASDVEAAIFGNAGATAANTNVFARNKVTLNSSQLDLQMQLRSNTANLVSVAKKRLAVWPITLVHF